MSTNMKMGGREDIRNMNEVNLGSEKDNCTSLIKM